VGGKNYKRFSQAHYSESDGPAKKAAAYLFWCLGYEVSICQNEEYQKGDLQVWMSNYPKYKQYVEAEQKRVWTTDFKWEPGFQDIMQVAYRKRKCTAFWFVMFNRGLNAAGITTMCAVKVSPVRTLSQTKMDGEILTENERFFMVPTDRVQFYHLLPQRKRWRTSHETGSQAPSKY